MPDLISADLINEEDDMSEPYEPDSVGDIHWIHSDSMRNITIRRRNVDMRNMRTINNMSINDLLYQVNTQLNIHNTMEEDYIDRMQDDII